MRIISNVLIFASVSVFWSCSLQNSLDAKNKTSDQEVIHAQAGFDATKICKRDDECQVVDRSCCRTGEWVAVSNVSALQAKADVKINCRKQLSDNRELCKDVKSTTSYPLVQCVSEQCEIKTDEGAQEAPPATTCAKDYECFVMDEDCCETGDNLVAVHKRDLAAKKREKIKRCSKEFADARQEGRDLCAGKPRAHRIKSSSVCEEGQCVVK